MLYFLPCPVKEGEACQSKECHCESQGDREGAHQETHILVEERWTISRKTNKLCPAVISSMN